MRTFALSTVAATALLLSAADVNALEGRGTLGGGNEYSGKTIWTAQADLTEIVRFPLKSTNPAYIVYVESLHPDPACSQEGEWNGECSRTLCEIWVAVRSDLQPVRSEPVQADPSRVLILWVNEDNIGDLTGHHMPYHQDFGTVVIGNGPTGEALKFHEPMILDYASGNQQCMAGVRVEYVPNVKNLFNRWRP